MNKIININLGGKAFSIDEDAFEYLQSYIRSLKKYFNNYEEKGDIIYDIESRLGEIIDEKMGSREIVNIYDVQEAVKQMGRPEDFAAEEEQEPKENFRKRRAKREESGDYRVGKKLLRDPDNKKIAGVCSGLAQYFGFKNAFPVRLLFFILFWFGLSPMVYVVLWILMPKPRNAADRLAMRGEDINYDNIAKEVQEEFKDLKDRLSNIGK